MIRTVLVLVPTPVCAALFLSAAAALPVAARGAAPHANTTGLTGYSMSPSGPSDHFVEGKYDKQGNYIPPHYQAKSKPPFHGYFFKKKPGDKDELGPMGITAKSK